MKLYMCVDNYTEDMNKHEVELCFSLHGVGLSFEVFDWHRLGEAHSSVVPAFRHRGNGVAIKGQCLTGEHATLHSGLVTAAIRTPSWCQLFG